MWWLARVRVEHPFFSPRAHRGASFKGRRRLRRPGREIVTECEAFLQGRLVESLENRAETVPVWAWTNLLAHGSAHALQAERDRKRRSGGGLDTEWQLARSYLAAEVLYCAELRGSLTELQVAVLVPLELKLASTREVATWRPGRWAFTVERALAQQVGPRK